MSGPAVVVGGSLAGLTTAWALARRGRRVRILERAEPPPLGPAAKAAETWERPTVPQGAHSHTLTSLGVRELRRHAPELLDAALEEGARLLDLTEAVPPGARGFVREPADDELVALAVRRPVLELVLHRAVSALPGVTISHGTTVRALSLDPAGARVTGVVTGSGEHVPARIVVDATGRRAESRSWLAAAGRPVADDLTSATHMRGFTRYFRLGSPDAWPGPLNRGNAAGGIWDHYAAVVHPCDNGVFAIALAVPTADRATTCLRGPGTFTAVARLSPYLRPWIAPGVSVPISPVRAITLPPNMLSGTVSGRRAPVAGLFPVGDAACVTDPIHGRGMSLAFQHAFRLAELLDDHPEGDSRTERALALAEEVYRPWYEQAARDSALRARQWRAQVEGAQHPPGTAGPADGSRPERPAGTRPPESATWLPESGAEAGRPPLPAVAAAAATDAAVWRGLTRILMSLDTPAGILDDEAFRARVRDAPVPVPAGPRPPTRQELLHAIAGAEEV